MIATGSMPLIIPVPGHDLPGVLTYRDFDDVNAMLIAAQSRDKAVVIGGGLLGKHSVLTHIPPPIWCRELQSDRGR